MAVILRQFCVFLSVRCRIVTYVTFLYNFLSISDHSHCTFTLHGFFLHAWCHAFDYVLVCKRFRIVMIAGVTCNTIIMLVDFELRLWRPASISFNQWISSCDLILMFFFSRFSIFQLCGSCCPSTAFGHLSHANLDAVFIKLVTLGSTFAWLGWAFLFILCDMELFRLNINQTYQLIASYVYWFPISMLIWKFPEVAASLILTVDDLLIAILETIRLAKFLLTNWVRIECITCFALFLWTFALEWTLRFWITCIAIDCYFLTNRCFGTW